VWRVLADPVRAQIVQILADGPACVCHLVEDLGASQPNVSNHIRVLRHAGIITGEPRGRFTFYRLNPAVLANAAAQLDELAGRAAAHTNAFRECA
jgi:ArsR family transcriptional regulator, arsenate/arsenite/antimonite-responsive transcriptional repressor